jgi:hypothetical protein
VTGETEDGDDDCPDNNAPNDNASFAAFAVFVIIEFKFEGVVHFVLHPLQNGIPGEEIAYQYETDAAL